MFEDIKMCLILGCALHKYLGRLPLLCMVKTKTIMVGPSNSVTYINEEAA